MISVYIVTHWPIQSNNSQTHQISLCYSGQFIADGHTWGGSGGETGSYISSKWSQYQNIVPKSLQGNNGHSFIPQDHRGAQRGPRDRLQVIYLLATPVFREGRDSEPSFKENLSRALSRDSWARDDLASYCTPQRLCSPMRGLRLSPLEMTHGRPFFIFIF